MPANTIAKFQKAVAITSVDEDQHIVYGIASTPDLDNQNDIVDPDAMKEALPDYLERGVLRYMHQDGRVDAVGRVFWAEVKDDGKTYIAAKVVDESAWAKVKAGVLQGFSIGGEILDAATEYIKDKLVRIIRRLRLDEISLVDSPANPEADILLFKFQGANKMAQKKAKAPVTGANQLASVAEATQAIERLRKRVAPPVKKAQTPDKLIDSLLDIHNDMVRSGNPDGADMITDGIACIQAALQDDASDQEQGTPDPNADDEPQEGVAAADGAGDGSDGYFDPSNPDDNGSPDGYGDGTEDQEAKRARKKAKKADMEIEDEGNPTEGESNPDQEYAMEGTEVTQTPENTTSENEVDDNQPQADAEMKEAARKKAAAKAKALLASKGIGVNKAMSVQVDTLAKTVTSLTGIIEQLTARLEKLEKRPRTSGPVLTPVDRGVSKVSGNGLQDEISSLEKMWQAEENPMVKSQLGNLLFHKRTRAMYGFDK